MPGTALSGQVLWNRQPSFAASESPAVKSYFTRVCVDPPDELELLDEELDELELLEEEDELEELDFPPLLEDDELDEDELEELELDFPPLELEELELDEEDELELELDDEDELELEELLELDELGGGATAVLCCSAAASELFPEVSRARTDTV